MHMLTTNVNRKACVVEFFEEQDSQRRLDVPKF